MTIKKITYIVISVALIAVLAFVYAMFSNARDLGRVVGSIPGTAIGTVVGGAQGFEEGYNDGKEYALSNPDVDTEVVNHIKEVGRLDVLKSSFVITDSVKMKEYAILYQENAEAVFSVNLDYIKVREINDRITIYLPDLETTIYVDAESREKLDEYSKSSGTGNNEDAINMMKHSDAEIRKRAEENIGSNTALYNAAKSSAILQVKSLAEAIVGKSVNVVFESDER